MVALNGGLISPQTAAKELKQSSTKTNLFTNITDEEIAALSDKPQSEGELGEGLFSQGSEPEGAAEPEHPGVTGLNPASSPSKALKEEDKVAKAKQQAKDSDGEGSARRWQGLDVVIETPRGYQRHGKDGQGKSWAVTLPYHYGYLRGHAGADGDSLDIALGPDPEATYVYLIDQKHLPPQKGFDETKVFANFSSQSDALKAFDNGHHDARHVIVDWTPMSVVDFKQWLVDRDPKKPACLASGV